MAASAPDHSMIYVLNTMLIASIMYFFLLGALFVRVTRIERREVEAKVYGIQIRKKEKTVKQITRVLSRTAIV